jgi:hypothetical protein
VFALLGFRFTLLAELHKIKKRIDWLLDLYNKATDTKTKQELQQKLEVERVKLAEWKEEHGYG